nr:hypothetical protein [Ruminococcus sp. A254.MGS-108]
MACPLCDIWNGGIEVDCAFTSSLYYRWMFGKVYFIVFSILYHFVCGCKGMYQEARE